MASKVLRNLYPGINPADQARILSHMGAIATAAADGVDLETWDGGATR